MHVGTFLKDSDHFYNVPSGGPIYGPEKCLKEFKIANLGQKYLKSAEIQKVKSSTKSKKFYKIMKKKMKYFFPLTLVLFEIAILVQIRSKTLDQNCIYEPNHLSRKSQNSRNSTFSVIELIKTLFKTLFEPKIGSP